MPRQLAEELEHTASRHWKAGALLHMREVITAYEAGDLASAHEAAHRAKADAPRSPSVREALGLIHLERGEFKDALSELLAFRRMTGLAVRDPAIAACYRALDRPEKALEALSLDPGGLDEEGRVEALVVRAGALADMGNLDAAMALLGRERLDPARLEEARRRLRDPRARQDSRVWKYRR